MPKKRRTRDAVNVWARGRSFYYEFRWKGLRYGPKSLGPVSRDVALRQVAEIRLAVIEGRYHERSVPTFGAFAAEFLRWYKAGRRPTSVVRYASTLLRLAKLWDTLPLNQITRRMIELDKQARASARKPQTVNMDLQIIRHLFRTAVAWDVLDENPAEHVSDVPVDERGIVVLTPAEEARLLRACRVPRLKRLIIFALETGLRPMEITTLRWSQVDVERRTVTVESGRAKSRRFRTVPLTQRALQAIGSPVSNDVRVFEYRVWRKTFRAATIKAGLLKCTPHVLRHTMATRALEAGVHIRMVQQWLGHHNLLQTMRYTHPTDAYEREAIRLIEKAYQSSMV